MQQRIDELKNEIQSYELEIAKLQQELAAAGGRTVELATSTEPSAIATAIRTEAVRIVEQQPILRGIQDAIAQLTSRLTQKKSQLQQLETAELKQQRLQRVEQGKSELRAKFSDIEKVAESLKNLFLELKEIALKYEKDFAEIHPPSSGHRQLNRAGLLNYEVLWLPQITEVDDRFILSSKVVDLFEAEKKAVQQQRLEASRRSRQSHQEMIAEIQQRERQQREQVEAQEREQVLGLKHKQLAEAKKARRDRLVGLPNANVTYFDDIIAALETEIVSLQESQDG